MTKIRRLARGVLVMLVAMSVVPVGAAGLRCESDPAVILSDGTVLDLTASIGAPIWDITSVSYTIHVPAGLQVVGVIRTPNWPTTKEIVNVYTDQARGKFYTETLVNTVDGTDVSARLTVKPGLSGGLLGVLSAKLVIESGWTGEVIPASVSFR